MPQSQYRSGPSGLSRESLRSARLRSIFDSMELPAQGEPLTRVARIRIVCALPFASGISGSAKKMLESNIFLFQSPSCHEIDDDCSPSGEQNVTEGDRIRVTQRSDRAV